MASNLLLPEAILANPYFAALFPLTMGNIIGFFTRRTQQSIGPTGAIPKFPS